MSLGLYTLLRQRTGAEFSEKRMEWVMKRRRVGRRPSNSGADHKSRKIDEVIYEQIYDAIRDHRLPPGTKLGEDLLGDVFGTNRMQIRRVLSRLADRRLVETQLNRGAFVATPSIKEARDVFATRQLIEPPLAALLAKSISRRQAELLRHHISAEQAARTADRREALRLSGQFHVELGRLAGNEVVVPIITDLVSRTSLIIAVYERRGADNCSLGDHIELADRIIAHDLKGASEQMRRHLKQIEERLVLEVPTQAPVNLKEIFGSEHRFQNVQGMQRVARA